MQKKIVFVQKTQKNGFYGVLRYALQQFGFLLCHSKDAQTHNNTALMEGQGVETEKRQFYRKENCVLGRGMAKERLFLLFSELHPNSSEYDCMTTMMLKRTKQPFN